MTRPVHRWDEGVLNPRGSVHILHGMAEHGRRYDRFARALNSAGFMVWAHDHRGHGENPAPAKGHFADRDGWGSLLSDARDVSKLLARAHPGLPLILFAHSMGSFVGQTLLAGAGTRYRAVILSGTNGPPGVQEATARSIAGLQRAALGARAPGKWLDKIVTDGYNRRFAPNRTRFDWLSRDDREVDKYRSDPLCGFPLTAQSWLDFLEGKAQLGSHAHLQKIPKTLPIHVIAGAADPVGEQLKGVTRLLSLYEKAGLTTVSHVFYAEARHELVNETNRDEVTRDLIAWLQRVSRG